MEGSYRCALAKKGDKHLSSNYRPISMLSTVGQVFERVDQKDMCYVCILQKYFTSINLVLCVDIPLFIKIIEMYNTICQSLEGKINICVLYFVISQKHSTVIGSTD